VTAHAGVYGTEITRVKTILGENNIPRIGQLQELIPMQNVSGQYKPLWKQKVKSNDPEALRAMQSPAVLLPNTAKLGEYGRTLTLNTISH